MRKYPVLFVSGTLEVGGSESKIVRIANALAKAGYASGIAYFNPPDTLLGRVSPDVSVTHLERRGKISPASFRRLQELVEDRYRIVFSVNFYPLLYVVPVVRLLGKEKARAIGLINTTAFVDRQRIIGHLYAPLLRRCDQIVYGCQAQQALWTGKYNLPPDRSTYIYNGVDSASYTAQHELSLQFRKEFGIPEGDVVIGSVGRFAPEKNFELLIEAVARLRASGRAAWLVIAGEGRERIRLEAMAAKLGLQGRSLFPGVLHDIRPAMAAMDIFVLPSRAVETFSNAALEAMSMARPVVLSNIGGAAEMVQHDESGYLFESGDLETLLDLLVRLYDSEVLRDKIGSAARERVREHFDFHIMLDRYKALIDSGTAAT